MNPNAGAEPEHGVSFLTRSPLSLEREARSSIVASAPAKASPTTSEAIWLRAWCSTMGAPQSEAVVARHIVSTSGVLSREESAWR